MAVIGWVFKKMREKGGRRMNRLLLEDKNTLKNKKGEPKWPAFFKLFINPVN